MTTKTVNLNPIFVDRPEVQEVFGDRVRSMSVVDGVMHIELCSTRVVPVDSDQPPKITAHTTGRWTMPIGTAIAMRDMLSQQITELERQGTLKMMQPIGSAPTPPKH